MIKMIYVNLLHKTGKIDRISVEATSDDSLHVGVVLSFQVG